MRELRIRLLGVFGMQVGPRKIAGGEWRLPMAKSLVKLLAPAPGHRPRRDQVLDPLWPELDAVAGVSPLHKVLHEARSSERLGR
ncbi:hypothetical protein [Streptomyces coeruleorubidus]|uniref:hypothetical protein n=1 Tax=Streptomyces coeruleorubidus TaxID=116188 RepID=UPI0033B7CA9A